MLPRYYNCVGGVIFATGSKSKAGRMNRPLVVSSLYLDLDGNEINLSPREFAEILKNSPVFEGKPVRLISCEAGAKGSINAQYLANNLGVDVLAPTDTVFIYPNGEMFVGPSIYERTGTWIVFKPQGK
jgi:hypothetical protein